MARNKVDQSSSAQVCAKDDAAHTLCTAILTKGKRKGLPCNRKINIEGCIHCKFHTNKSVDVELCTVILTKGERKNKPCNRKVVEGEKLCKRHMALEAKRPYNPYVEKETDVCVEGNRVQSPICNLNMSKLNGHLRKYVT